MAFQEGHEKVGGREKGTPNKMTRGIKEVVQRVLDYLTDEKVDEICKDVKDSKGEVLVNFIAKLAPKDLNVKTEIKTSPLADELKTLRGETTVKNNDSTDIAG